MSIVDFAQVHCISPTQATPIPSAHGAMGTTSDAGRPTLYDPLWGYFTFGQTVQFEATEAEASDDRALFAIDGVFTPNAEGVADNPEDAIVTALMAKYLALEAVFKNAAKAVAPKDLTKFGGATDPRCIALPMPLKDKDGLTIYTCPENLRLERGILSREVRYHAELKEAKFSVAKLIINDLILDNGVVTITLPTPVFARHQMVGASGEVLQLKHYKTMEVEVTGSMPLIQAHEAVSPDMKSLAASLELGTLKLAVGIRDASGVTVTTLYPSLAVVDEPTVEIDYERQGAALNVRARE